MSHISRIPLPSIALVLTTDHARIPRRPSVIKVAAAPVPTIKVHPPQDEMTQPDLGDLDGSLNNEEPMHECHVHPVHAISEEDDVHMDLAESICEAPIVDQQNRLVVVELIKEKISNVLFSFRRLFCLDLPQTCFPGVTRQ
ncbi:hypothetical protein D9619_012141 [Psilocybe cf. subviscida]|uniref:Uncharacterized protein n=1 Tax=Psilocybe cf. subviscida TaxID=2480587 RepID=A0A8H5B7Q7_9AGAR|nr:hypothetical protein D9619_012141 [Psilocybe cf. subviscida]